MKIEVYTTGYEGYIEKTANVYTNDPAWNMVVLTIKAQIKPAISISPRRLRLAGKKGEAVNGEVEITANLDKPLILKSGSFSLTERMRYTIKEVEKGKRFIVQFKREQGLTEPLDGYLKIETNYPEKPEISLFVSCELIESP